ncbi:MAG: thiamine phosphate synthase [Fibromonadaceae bacterium]|nr:thiamine phosphate synthase [Fibromonadaceae bacterium]
MRSKHIILSKLHILTWDKAGISHLEQVRQLLNAGADWIQLRQKSGTEQEKLLVAKEAVKLAQKYNAILIINDSPQIALESGASGVHLGQTDMPPLEARKILGKEAIIGGTANTPEQAKQLEAEGCSYIGLGPWRTTQTKENLSEVLGESGIKKVTSLRLNTPIIAIGGISPQDIPKILSLGVHGIAISSYIVAAKNIKEAFSIFKP